MTQTPSLADVVAVVHRRYDPATAEDWDAVGLVCGDPAAEVRRVLVAVDPVAATVDEALGLGADLLLTHHPLLLRPVSSVAATTPAGALVHRLVSGGCALLAAHTNADVAREGVSDDLAAALGLTVVAPLLPDGDGTTGLGRIGTIEPLSLEAFAAHVAASLPVTAHGVRVQGDPARRVQRVAVIGGSGGDALGVAAAAGVDVVVTSDLKHHVALDHLAAGGPALVDVAHFASEWPWVPAYASLLHRDLLAAGYDVDVQYSSLVTDPWTSRA
ncbi:MAG: Nif3-like dinuclear metal center hexameric protein [Candidatus Nanopelagicales bacterium]